MENNKIIEKVEKIVEPHLKEMNLSLVDVEYLQEGGYWYVRVFIEDLDGDVGIDDCEKLSRLIEDDVDKLIDQRFFLEVSSPGLERPLKKIADYQRFCGEKISVVLKKKLGDKKNFIGILEAANDEKITMEIDGEKIEFEYKDIKKSNLVFEFTDF